MDKKQHQGARRRAIITGGAQGIGRGTAAYLIEHGWQVVLIDRDEEALSECRAAYGDDAIAIAADVGREDEVVRAFNTLVQEAGGGAVRLDLLVNNSGIADPCSGPIEDLSLAGWNRWIDASLTAAFLCTRSAVPMLRTANGSIVNIASTRAVQSEPESEAYAAAKGGLVALTHALAISLGPDIRVNAILPGWIETGPWQKSAERREPEHSEAAKVQHPAGRIGTPQDIAALIAWLTGPEAGFVTGQNFTVDGGMTRKMIYTA